jgi:hypothetical protein
MKNTAPEIYRTMQKIRRKPAALARSLHKETAMHRATFEQDDCNSRAQW